MSGNSIVTDLAWCALGAGAVSIVALLARWEVAARQAEAPDPSTPAPSPTFSVRDAGLTMALVLGAVALSASLGHYLRPLLVCTAGCGDLR